MAHLVRSVFLLGASILLLVALANAAPTARQRTAVNTLKRKVAAAEDLYRKGQYSQAAEALNQLRADYDTLLEEAAKEPDLVGLLEPVYNDLARVHALLELEGFSAPAPKKPTRASNTPSGDGISFTKQIAPILVAKCGRCHVDQQRGMFSMATYEALMRGSQGGKVIFPGDANGGRLIELVESGDMPRGGLRLTPEELMTLKSWIGQGAKFDGTNPQQPLRELVPGGATATASLSLARPTGKETVSFAADIAPVLVEQCVACHSPGNQQPGGRFNMATFQAMLRGGDNGLPWVPGKPDESLLIQKLRGTAGGARMPRNRPPLSDELIERFAKWVAEGATFDGRDPQQDLEQLVLVTRASRADHNQLAAMRLDRSRQLWQTAFPGVTPEHVSTENFELLGTVGPNTLKDVAREAEEVGQRVAELFKVPGGRPKVKGKIVLFVLNSRYDYSELGKMIEQRQLPADWRAHWRYTVFDAYGALVVARGEGESNEGLLAHVIGGVLVASHGEVPYWFAEGAGRAAAARLTRRDPRIATWDALRSEAFGAMKKPEDFLTGSLPADLADVCSYRFVNFLITRDARRVSTLLRATAEGQPFDAAFARIFGATPAQLAALWYQAELRGAR